MEGWTMPSDLEVEAAVKAMVDIKMTGIEFVLLPCKLDNINVYSLIKEARAALKAAERVREQSRLEL